MYNNSHKALCLLLSDCLRGIICKKINFKKDNKMYEKIYVDKIPYKLLWFFKHWKREEAEVRTTKKEK